MSSWRITAKGVEHIVFVLMLLFFVVAVSLPLLRPFIGLSIPLLAIMELLILVIVAMFGMLYLLGKIWEIQVYGLEEHHSSGFFRKHDVDELKKLARQKKKSSKTASKKK
ncbi:MAG: hypothetical protein ACOCZV_01180 [Nanoarchaeota archaeon]